MLLPNNIRQNPSQPNQSQAPSEAYKQWSWLRQAIFERKNVKQELHMFSRVLKHTRYK